MKLRTFPILQLLLVMGISLTQGQYDPNFSLSINSGGPEITHLGETFIADQYFSGGSTYSNSQLTMDPLYNRERYSSTRTIYYEIPVENGSYSVSLHFAEIYYGVTGGLPEGGVGDRIFDVSIENELLEDNMDIYAEVGGATPLIKNYVIDVTDGVLSIYLSSLEIDGGVNHPKISGIQVSGLTNGNWTQASNNIFYNIGNVGIGTTDIGTWRLAVEGKIRAREIKVDNDSWPDYVFKPNYRLPSLEEVEEHIQEKGHLINIPSAEEVEANGIELGEMNKLLLEKIEELTLYVIQLQAQIETIKKGDKNYQ